MKELNNLIDVLEARIHGQDILNTNVSTSSVGWHIEHCLLTIDIITETIRQSSTEKPKTKFNIWKHAILVFQKIPRKKVKAPKIVQPQIDINAESLQQHIGKTREAIRILPHLDPKQYFMHPFLGPMNRNQTIKFLKVHTRHHLGIMNEIINKSRAD